MTRTYLSLATVFVLALAGCANKNTETQNPDTTGGGVDGTDGGGDDTASTPSRARKSTAPRGAGRNTKARQITAKKPPRAPVTPGETPPESGPNGLLAQGYQLDAIDALPDFSALGEPTERFEVPNLDYGSPSLDASEGFPGAPSLVSSYALHFAGSINIVEEAEYELCLHSDDGSRLMLEGTLVIDNDGVLDEPVEACELVYLAAGEYRLDVEYFQRSGPQLALHFAWAINGGDKVIVPTEVLFKP